MKKRGLTIFPVDHEFNTHKTAVSTVNLNLQDEHSQNLVEEMITTMKPAGVHMGLPYRTCSRARDKPLPSKLKGHFPDPPPLRDAHNLLGFSHLTGSHATKVQAANVLYKWGVKILHLCFKLCLNVSIENPERSWIWGVLTLLVKEYNDAAFLAWFEGLDRVTFHTCMHGGKRAKNTRLLATPGLYGPLAVACDQSHTHEPWGITKIGNSLQYDTAAEAEYPQLLCQRMADLLATKVQLPVQPSCQSVSRTSRRVMGHHVKQAPPLVPEFASITEMIHEPSQPGYRLLASHFQGQTTEMDEQTSPHKEQDRERKKQRKTFKVGVQHEPQHFPQAAKRVPHPMSPQRVLPDSIKAALFDNLTMDPIELAKSRMKAVLTVKDLAKDLEAAESKMQQSFKPSVKEVLNSKRIALWETLLKASNFSDMGIVQIVKDGAELTGTPEPSPLFPMDWKPAVASEDELLSTSLWRRKSRQSIQNAADSIEDSQSLHQATLEEVKLGHLSGPFSEQELDSKFGKGKWLFNKRFALHQGTPEMIVGAVA